MNFAQSLEHVFSGQDLSEEVMTEVMRTVMTGEATPAQIGALTGHPPSILWVQEAMHRTPLMYQPAVRWSQRLRALKWPSTVIVQYRVSPVLPIF